MSDLIDRQAAIDAIRASTSKYTGFMEMEMYTDDDAVEAIEAVPTIDAVPREELFNLFIAITSAEYTKQRFFAQEDGTIYDRCKGDYLHNFDLAVVRFCNELSNTAKLLRGNDEQLLKSILGFTATSQPSIC